MCETKERIVEVLKLEHEGWNITDNSIGVNISNIPYYAKECKVINKGIVSVSYRTIMPVIENVSVYPDKDGKDKTVVVKFADGTTERASTRHGDAFDLETGISLCIAKKMYATLAKTYEKSSGFSKIVHKAVKIYKNGIKEEEARKKREAEEKLAEQRKEAKRKKRAEKRRQRKVNLLKDAFVAAFNETKKEG